MTVAPHPIFLRAFPANATASSASRHRVHAGRHACRC